MADNVSDDKKMERINKLVFGNGMPERCKGKKWKDPSERLECIWPSPPIGRWKAVYTRDFAIAHNLPVENVSTDLTSGVDYMDMEVMPYGRGGAGTACQVNMLIKKPHDVSVAGGGRSSIPLPENRKLAHLIDLDRFKERLKPMVSVYSGSRDFRTDKSGYRVSTIAVYAEDVLPGYDYVSANAGCMDISRHEQYFPGGYAFWVMKASVWGRYGERYPNLDTPGRPKEDQAFDESFFSLKIPHELISTVFDGVVMGGK